MIAGPDGPRFLRPDGMPVGQAEPPPAVPIPWVEELPPTWDGEPFQSEWA